MEDLIYFLVICISAPMLLMFFIASSKTRQMIGFLMLGMCIAVLASELNALFAEIFADKMDYFHLTVSVTPICEELLKAFPLIFMAIVFVDNKAIIYSAAIFIGIGFAVLENTVIILQNIETVTLVWALIRGFASGLMHALSTVVMGIGISMVRKQKKVFICGTFALLLTVTTYHSIFNMLVQSAKYMYVGALVPILTYIPLLIVIYKKKWLKDE